VSFVNVIGVIMGGGQGQRLQPLTRDRAKPAVPIAGKYRLVDIPISNCINSGIRRIFLLTQFNSVSLHRHVQSTYRFDQFSQGYVQILAAMQTTVSESWYQGTADAVRQNFRYFMDEDPELIVVLSGDQLYRLNIADVIQQHVSTGADVTITTKPVERHEAGNLGIMQVDDTKRITRFVEKPGDTPTLDGLRAPMYKQERYLASMGIYLFNTKVLRELLNNDHRDFGKHIIPASIDQCKVYSYIFEGYWKDIGTIRSFWEANLALTEVVPEFNFYDAKAPIHTHMRYLPPSKINCCDLNRCLLSEGCIISGHRILHSIIGIRAIVGEGSVMEHSVIMGADFYESLDEIERNRERGVPDVGIGRDCEIRDAIVDKNARIGHGVRLVNGNGVAAETADNHVIVDGIIVVPKDAVIPDGTVI